jgi:hypothetical protein
MMIWRAYAQHTSTDVKRFGDGRVRTEVLARGPIRFQVHRSSTTFCDPMLAPEPATPRVMDTEALCVLVQGDAPHFLNHVDTLDAQRARRLLS